MRRWMFPRWSICMLFGLVALSCTEENPTANPWDAGQGDGRKTEGGTGKDLAGEHGQPAEGGGVADALKTDYLLCTPNTFLICKTSSQILRCNADGTGTTLVDCSPSQCDSTLLRCSQCDPLTPPSCQGNTLLICSPEGMTILTQCPEGCQSGACLNCSMKTFFRDGDSDGYGDPLVPLESCYQPGGYVLNNLDCDDLDPAAHPGQPAFFNDPTKGTATYDFNCNKVEEQEFPAIVNCVQNSMTCNGDGWLASIPACGKPGDWAKCSKQGRGTGCGITTSVKVQGCH
jgi:hypothetical protein